MSRSREKNLWDLAIEEDKKNKANESENEEFSVLVIGSRNCGKSGMIARFLERDEAQKNTVGLEYRFAWRSKGHNFVKSVGHIWELGGGTWLSKLIDIPLNADELLNTTLVLMLDLSKPNELWFTLESLLKSTKQIIDGIVKELSTTDSEIKHKLKKRCWERLGLDHTDKSKMTPFLIPLVIIGSRYDEFQAFDPENRKVICKTLRFMAHTYGASVQFYSTKHDALVKLSRALLSSALFGSSPSKTVQFDHNKPLIIPAGHDSFSQIGTPPLSEGDIGQISARSQVEVWKHAYTRYFPQENINNPAMVADPAKDPQYREPVIDALRAQKDQELERYRRLCERKYKEQEQNS